MNLIADEKILYTSPYPQEVYCYSPSIVKTDSGRLLASFDLSGPGISKLPGVKSCHGDFSGGNQCKIFASDDNGQTWKHLCDHQTFHARLFTDGPNLYLLGHDRAITVSRSCDDGNTWSEISNFKNCSQWHQSPCGIYKENGFIYLTMERKVEEEAWPAVAPVMMRGKAGSDLTRIENWIFSNELVYPSEAVSTLGIPFYHTGLQCPGKTDPRYCGPPGFLESHVVKIHDKTHNLYAKDTLHVWMRMHSGLTNIAAIAKCRILPDNTLSLELEKTPAGSTLLHVPCPGGHLMFHIEYDEATQYYWLVGSQSRDSMTRPNLLDDDRYNLPDNERNRLVLHFSRNLFDWCFAGVVAIGETPKTSRQYPSMIIDGEDLLILCRSGNSQSVSAHNGNLITLHRVKEFRKLLY